MASNLIHRVFGALGLMAFMQAASAQGTITILPTVLPPYSANYVDYFTDPTQVAILLVNSDTENRSVYLAGSVGTVDGTARVSVPGGIPWGGPPLELAPGATQLTGADLQPFLQGGGAAVQYEGITEEQLILGQLPEGIYWLCLQAFDYYTNEPLSPEQPSGCSPPFPLVSLEPPVLLAPACEDEVVAMTPQFVLFNWMLPQGIPAASVVHYNFRLVRVWDAINAQSALESSTDLVHEETTFIPSLFYNQTMPALVEGQQYAWWVQSTLAMGDGVFNNNGYSAPCTFTYRAAAQQEFQLAYPFPNDTLPWSNLPVMVKFEPHAAPAQTGRFHSTLNINKDGVVQEPTERKPANEDILWNSGPFASQRFLLNQAGVSTATFTEDEARHVNMYRNTVTAEEAFAHGSVYDMEAEVRINTYNESDPRYGNVSGTFVSGMGRPVPLEPADYLHIPINGPDTTAAGVPRVRLKFRTAEPPVDLLPPFPIWIIPEEGPPTQTNATINERWRLQVSREPDFQQVLVTRDEVVGAGIELNSTTCDETCARAALYKEVEVEYTPSDTGWYYWRVGWLTNTDDLNSDTYHDGPVRRFYIQGDTAQAPVAEVVRAPECLAESRRAPTPLAERIPVTIAALGDTVEVGLFSMRITQISYNSEAATGEGLIEIPQMRVALRVGFVNAYINAKKRLYDGLVNGLYDNAGVIPQGWTVGGSMAVGFSPQAAAGIDNFLNTSGRLVSQFAGNAPMGLPIGIDTQVPDGRVIIGILGMQFTDTIARLNAGAGIPLHGIGQTVGLGNMSIPFHPNGIGDDNAEGTLYLLGDVNAPVAGDTLRIRGARFANGFSTVQDSGTFVAWDCRGFRAFTIDAEWRFSQDRLREDLPDGEDGPDKIVASLKVRTGRAGLFGRVDFNKPFHLTGTKGYGFDVQEAWLDMASYMNPPDIDLPMDVLQAVGLADEDTGEELTTFEGFYLKRGMLRLPPEIQRTGSTERITAIVDDLVINGTGMTGKIKATDLVGPDEASLDGWGYSIDTLQLDIVTNSFHRAGMKGRIHLPITDTLLAYTAMFTHDIGDDDHYLEFLLRPEGTIQAEFLMATMDLQNTSYLRAVMLRNDTAAFAKVMLNGQISVTGNMPGAGNINFRDIQFQGLYFQTRAPYTNAIDGPQVFSLASPQKFLGGIPDPDDEDAPPSTGQTGGFPVSITRVKVDRRNIDGTPLAGIGFDINLQLTGSSNIFVATTRIAVLGELNTSSLHEWGHHSVELDSIGVRGEVGSVKIEGGLRWYNGDGTYGDGINGRAKAWFMKGALEVNAAVQFGNRDGLKYWFADAMIAKDNGFSPGSAFNVYGFGGGAWYHMKRNSPLPSAQQVTTATIANQNDSTYTPGLTLSGVSYLPDAAMGYGFQATMVFGDGSGGRAYNGDLTAGMTLSASGGVNTAFLDGNVFMMTERNDHTHVPIRGAAHIQFDFPNDVFSGLFDMYVNIGSGGLVTGTGANDLAGRAELLITPDTWHFFVGTPQTPIGLDFRGIFRTTSYFMVGRNLPSPLPPQNPAVQAIIPANYYIPLDLADASGIAFGARGDVNDTLKYYIFRMRYGAGVGLDMAFTNSTSMACPDIPSPGLNGWYASGQMYAFLTGAVSVHVDLWFAKGDYTIMELAAAAMMQGGFANPSWMRGVVGGNYNILAGAVSGSFSLPFEVGERCQPTTDGVLAGVNPIGDIMPRHNTGITAGDHSRELWGEPRSIVQPAAGHGVHHGGDAIQRDPAHAHLPPQVG